jgi:proteasome lid subunit RPN8/RPN11
MHDAIVAHARQESPRECCGVIAGRAGLPEKLYSLRNIAEGNVFYEIDPLQLMELEFKEFEKDNSEIVAIYHSHPASRAYPSKTDVELAFWPQAVYLICSLEDPERPYIRGFQIRDETISEVALRA